jgi:hypothetical protein
LGSKAAGTVARIAGAFHVLEHGDRADAIPIAPDAIKRAERIVDVLADHSLAVLESLVASPAENDAIKMLRWAKRHAFKEFSESKLHEHLRTLSPERMAEALSVLEARHFIRRRPASGKRERGRPASPVWDVNPMAFLAPAHPSISSSNSEKGRSEASFANSPNCMNDRQPTQSRQDPQNDGESDRAELAAEREAIRDAEHARPLVPAGRSTGCNPDAYEATGLSPEELQ